MKLSPTFASLPEAECRAAFDAAVAEKANRAAVAVGGDLQFRQLLVQLQPPIKPNSMWSSVRRAVRIVRLSLAVRLTVPHVGQLLVQVQLPINPKSTWSFLRRGAHSAQSNTQTDRTTYCAQSDRQAV